MAESPIRLGSYVLWRHQITARAYHLFDLERHETMAVDRAVPILVVDDSTAIVRIIRGLLKQLGFVNVDDANDGPAALTKMRAKPYGLIISDWNMEAMSGYDFLREVRADPKLKQTAFIMVTGEQKPENVVAAKRAGVNNYIVKPFDAPTLKAKIEATFVAKPC
jgi:two-component system, chemotaxis family, chemotaxis protein CheY